MRGLSEDGDDVRSVASYDMSIVSSKKGRIGYGNNCFVQPVVYIIVVMFVRVASSNERIPMRLTSFRERFAPQWRV